jgi:hypothetical protein
VGWPSTEPRSGGAPRLMAGGGSPGEGTAWASVAVVLGAVGVGRREGFFGESLSAALYSESWRCDAAVLKLCRYLDLREPPHAFPIKRRGEAAGTGASIKARSRPHGNANANANGLANGISDLSGFVRRESGSGAGGRNRVRARGG